MVYTIGEVAKMLEVSRESLRNWEKLGCIPKVYRRPTNRREYTEVNIETIKEFLDQKNLTK